MTEHPFHDGLFVVPFVPVVPSVVRREIARAIARTLAKTISRELRVTCYDVILAWQSSYPKEYFFRLSHRAPSPNSNFHDTVSRPLPLFRVLSLWQLFRLVSPLTDGHFSPSCCWFLLSFRLLLCHSPSLPCVLLRAFLRRTGVVAGMAIDDLLFVICWPWATAGLAWPKGWASAPTSCASVWSRLKRTVGARRQWSVVSGHGSWSGLQRP